MAFFQIIEIPKDSPWHWSKEDLEGTVIICNKDDVTFFKHHPEGKYYDPCIFLTGEENDYL